MRIATALALLVLLAAPSLGGCVAAAAGAAAGYITHNELERRDAREGK
jgi:hypothetical protein